MTKIFISQLMNGRCDEEVIAERAEAEKWAKRVFPDATFIDSWISEMAIPDGANTGLMYLGESIKRMAEADIVLLWGDWGYGRGCQAERKIASLYGIPVITNGGIDD